MPDDFADALEYALKFMFGEKKKEKTKKIYFCEFMLRLASKTCPIPCKKPCDLGKTGYIRYPYTPDIPSAVSSTRDSRVTYTSRSFGTGRE